MKEIYKKIIEILFSPEVKQQFVDAGITPVVYVDFYKGQYLNYEKFDVTGLPAVLVEWSASITNKDINESLVSIKLHAIYEQVLDTSNLNPNLDGAIKYFDFLTIVNNAISTIQVEGSGKLKLRAQDQVQLDRPGIVHLLTYEGSFSGFDIDVASTFEYTEEDTIDFAQEGDLISKFPKNEAPFYPIPPMFD